MSLIEIHVIQNFSPSNLNRDDTGSPKDCEFGGYRRARISSQCQKRAVRRYFDDSPLLSSSELAIRTKRAAEYIAEQLVASGRPEESAAGVAQHAVKSLGIPEDTKRPGLTGYLLYLSKNELNNLASWANKHWDALAAAAANEAPEGKSKTKKKGKAEGGDEELKAKLNGKRAADLALFGRMLANLQEHSLDAAAQVAHAISTHRVNVEFDYFTAVDDRKPDDTAAADMVGTVEFNSACYYRYANVSLRVLAENLQNDDGLVRRTVEAFLRGFALSIPTGKQNSMAAHNPPSFLLAVRRASGPCNLSNAFVKPVQAGRDQSLIEASVKALDTYWGRLVNKFGGDGIEDVVAWSLDDQELTSIPNVVPKFDDLIARICGPAPPEQAA